MFEISSTLALNQVIKLSENIAIRKDSWLFSGFNQKIDTFIQHSYGSHFITTPSGKDNDPYLSLNFYLDPKINKITRLNMTIW